MKNGATERLKELRYRTAGGGKWDENEDKIVFRRNEPKGLLKIKQLAFFGTQKRNAFSGQKPPTKAKYMAKNPPLVGHFPV